MIPTKLVCYPAGKTETTFALPTNILEIKPKAFYGNTHLNTIDLHSGITSIGESCFKNCTGLNTINLFASIPPYIGSNAFDNTTLLIYVNDDDYNTYINNINWSQYASRITTFSSSPFITEWETTLPNESITLPLTTLNSSTFNCVIDWGDSSSSTVTGYEVVTHLYTDAGLHQVVITGACEGWSFPDSGSSSNLLIKRVINWGFGTLFSGFHKLSFMNCTNLIDVGDSSIKFTSYLGNLSSLFAYTSLTTISENIFKYCTGTYTLSGAFLSTKLVSIPSDLFKYNTSCLSFNATFYQVTTLKNIPYDLFINNISVTNFSLIFAGCETLEIVPPLVLSYSDASSISFQGAFTGDTSLALNRNIFYSDGQQATKFIGKAIDFGSCFARSLYTGIQGEAPDLWNCTYNVITNSQCFSGEGNSLTSLSNYASIPSNWIV